MPSVAPRGLIAMIVAESEYLKGAPKVSPIARIAPTMTRKLADILPLPILPPSAGLAVLPVLSPEDQDGCNADHRYHAKPK